MAIYHFSAKMIKRSEGQSATAHAAYCAHEKITDFRTGEIHDYRRRNLRDQISYAEIIAPANAPEFCVDRAQLWSQVELAEKRKDAQVARSITLALPVELNPQQNQRLVRQFCKDTFADSGMVADACIHDIESQNPHAHIILTTRELTPDGFGKKNRRWNEKSTLEHWRKSWSDYANNALKAAEIDARIDHRSYAEQGINLVPQIHLGKTVAEMERRGQQTPRGDINRLVQQRNMAAIEIERPPRRFNEDATELAKLNDLLEHGATPSDAIQLIDANVKEQGITFNDLAQSAFNNTAQQRLQHTIDLSLHRTKRRIIKRSPQNLIEQSKTLSKRLSEEMRPRLTAESKVAKMSVFERFKEKIAAAGRSVWEMIKKPFVEEPPEPRKKSLFGGYSAPSPEQQNTSRSEDKTAGDRQPPSFKR